MNLSKNLFVSNLLEPIKIRFFMVAVCIFVFGLYFSFQIEQQVKNDRQTILQDILSSKVENLSNNIINELENYEDVLTGLSANVNSIQLSSYTQQHHLNFYLNYNSVRQLPGFINTGLAINSYNKTKEDVVDKKSELSKALLIVKYIQPEKGNRQWIGNNLGEQEELRYSALQAATLNSFQLSAPIRSQRQLNKHSHFWLFLPIIQQNQTSKSGSSNNAWVFTSFSIDKVLSPLLSELSEFTIEVSDVYLNKHQRFYKLDAVKKATQSKVDKVIQVKNSIKGISTINVYGRQWQISLLPTARFISSLQLENPAQKRNEMIVLTVILSSVVVVIGFLVSSRLGLLNQKLSYNAVVENTTAAIIAVDQDFLILHWNESAQALFTEAVDNLIYKGSPLLNLLKPYISQDKLITLFKQVSRGESIVDMPLGESSVCQHEEKYFQISIIPLLQKNDFVGAVISIVNVTELVVLQNTLQGKNKLLEQKIAKDTDETLSLKRYVSLTNSALDNSQDVLLWLDDKGVVIHLNDYANSLLSGESGSIKHRNITDIIVLQNDESWLSIKQDIQVNKRLSLERFYKQDCGDVVPMLISCCQLVIDDDVIYYLAAKNISERLAEENKLKTALLKADSASKSKTTFISKMSHELRTPLNIANGMLQMLELSALSDIQRTSVDGAKQSMKQLTYIIDDIMDLSDAERGLLKLDNSEFLLDEILNDISFHLSNIQADKMLEVHFLMDDDVPSTFYGDAKKLRQVILNIASNAVKFTSTGEVIIQIQAQRNEKSDVTLWFSITDTGIGIDDEQLSQIFELFSQSDNSSSRHYGGLGVGLTIAHQFVQLMGGDLTVESKPEQGSTFRFNIPLVEVNTSTLLPAIINKKLSVLLVDDNPTALNLLGNTIQFIGWDVSVASNAKDGFLLFQQAAEKNTPFDLVLLDWKMPEMDGWQLAEEIRTSMPETSIPLVIMVAASSRQKLAEKSAETPSVLNGFITKPVTRSMLIDAISDAIAMADSHSEIKELKTGGQHNEKKLLTSAQKLQLTDLRILVVEDNPTNQIIAKTLLQSQGALVDVAEGGYAALTALNDNTFDFVLMDIQMPDLDGYETTRRIRADQRYSALPIYAMTANVSDSDKQKCYQAGMDGHISKPFELEYVTQQILKATSGKNVLKSTLVANRKVEECVNEDVIEYCKNKEIDLKKSLARFNYLTDLYTRSLALFIDDLKVDLVTLSSILAAHTPAILNQEQHIIFHTMKSSALSLGFTQLGELAKEIDLQISNNKFIKNKQLGHTQCVLISGLMTKAVDDIQGLLTLLTKDTPEVIIKDQVDLNTGFDVLYKNVIEFNMNAIESYQDISVSLNSLSQPITEKLEQSLNKLRFSDAKVHLDALKQLLMEE